MSPRKVLVTGASRGIGRATAVAFARQGATVVINHPHDDDAAEEAARLVAEAGGAPITIAADLADEAEVAAMMDRIHREHGRLDVVVNNVGICPFSDFFDIGVELWDRVHNVNLRGAFLVPQAATREMCARPAPGA